MANLEVGARVSSDEVAERRLVEFLVQRVRQGLSGSSAEDLVDLPPSRALFAGVLQAPRERDEDAARRGLASGDAPMGTALGMEFRIKPTGTGPPSLRIKARWAVYYPVFPSYEQAVDANGEQQPENEDAADNEESAAAAESDVLGEGASDVNPSNDGAGSQEAPESKAGGRVILPRIWRRAQVVAEVGEHVLSGGRTITSAGQSSVEEELERVRATIENDPKRWHHLGQIKDRERAVGESRVLASQQQFLAALEAKRGDPVVAPDWDARLQVETRPDQGSEELLRVRLLLVNVTSDRPPEGVDAGLEDRALYDGGVEVEISGGELVPFDFVLAPKDYRSNPEMPAKGINCSVQWAGDGAVLRTETLPVFAQPLYRTRESVGVTFEALANEGAIDSLAGIGDEMTEYLAAWQSFLDGPESRGFSADERAACIVDKGAVAAEQESFRLGMECLQRDPLLLRAFNLMNRTFAVLGERSGGRLQAWRLFQIAFVCSQLPSLAIRELDPAAADEYAERVRASHPEVGVLWFPTGGGKTEAYLGLIAVALLYDRLRGKTRGMTAWMRFPLRMLSLQQLDRLAKVIAALNELRGSEPAVSEGDPFAIGYYVGDNNTPNSVSDDDMRRYESDASLRNDVKLVRDCPHCGASVRMVADRSSWRLRHVCENDECFSNTSESLGRAKGSLPFFVVDTEIYRYLPSVLLGTVDKLAIIGRNRYFPHLVRGVRQMCPEHGYTSFDECIEHWNGCKRKRSQLVKLEAAADPAPSLLIQDELHLLRDELGVFNGHYEGLLRYLCSLNSPPPKVLCATATIEAYDVQAFHVYLSRARRFPQPGWSAGESFYATSTPIQHRRFYVGLASHTRAIEDAALRVLSLYQREVRRFKKEPALADELVGAGSGSSFDAPATLRLHDLSVCYVNRKAVGGSIIEKLPRADKPLVREGLGELRGVLLTGDQTIDEVGATLERIERELAEVDEPRLDVLAATNLISHGVDLERINMMAICGMPSHYAEYVQATSRSARMHPGVAFVCFNNRDPRERSQFEFFYPMHEHMERLIEAVAVNRFASYAPRKTVPGLLVGLLLNKYTPDLFGSGITRSLDHVPTLQAVLGLRPGTGAATLDLDELREIIEAIIGVDVVRPPASPAQVENAKRQVELTFNDLMGSIGRTLESKLQDVVQPITSFRDVDEGIEFGSIDSATLIMKLRSR